MAGAGLGGMVRPANEQSEVLKLEITFVRYRREPLLLRLQTSNVEHHGQDVP